MPTLKVLKGPNDGTLIEGTMIPLDSENVALGRDPECEIVIPINNVSRKHARILRQDGKFFIEDNNSRNHTFVNNVIISNRTALKNNDRIRICDFIVAYLETPDDFDDAPQANGAGAGNLGQATVEATVNQTGAQLLETAPAEKLRLMVEIGNNLSKSRELNTLLPKVADSMFQLFKQADRCFIIMAEGDKLIPRVVKARRATDEGNARFSKSIVRKAIDEAKGFLSADASQDDRIQASQSVVDFKIRSVMCAPLCRDDGKAFAVIQLDTQDRAKKFVEEDLKLLSAIAATAAISLENARMTEDAVKNAKTQSDLNNAKIVQASFLPKSHPAVDGYEFWGFNKSAREVGGDYYGYIPLANGRLLAAIGDVAGKGVPASLLMSKLSSDIRFTMLTEEDPCQAVNRLNNLLYEFTNPLDKFITLIAAIVDPKSHQVTLLSAGHDSPLVYQPTTGEVIEAFDKDFGGMPLGMMDDLEYEKTTTSLNAGEFMVLYSDGVSESKNIKEEDFRVDNIKRIMKEMKSNSAQEIGERLVAEINKHAAGRDPHDDVTVIVVKRTA